MITTLLPKVAVLPNESWRVAVIVPESTPAVAEVAPERAICEAVAALTVKA